MKGLNSKQPAYSREELAQRRAQLEPQNPGYLHFYTRINRMMQLALLLRGLSLLAQYFIGEQPGPFFLILGGLNLVFGYFFYHVMLHVQWMIAIPLFFLNALVGATSNFDLILLLPQIPGVTKLLVAVTILQFSYELLFMAYICIDKNVHRLQQLNRLAASDKPLP